MGFNETALAAQTFSEDLFGESFTYGGSTFSGVFNQVEIEYQFDDYSTRKETRLICVTSKTQWTTAGATPADRGELTYGSIIYQVEKIDGSNSTGEPAYTLTLKKLT